MFKIFDKLGGTEPTLDVIHRRRKMKNPRRLTARAVQDWKDRKAIPAINAVLLMAECQERGIPFEWSDCVLEDPMPKSKSKSFPRRKAGSTGP